MTGWVFLLDYLLLPLICYLLFGVYMNEFIPQVHTVVWILIVLALSTIINIVGMKIVGAIDTVIIAGQIIFTVAFVALCIRYVIIGGADAGSSLFMSKNFFNPETFDFKNLFSASAILCVSFLGYDAVSTMAEETKNPKKTISRAIMLIAIGAGIAFAIVSYFSQAAWPLAFEQIEDPDAGIFELLPKLGGNALATVFLVTDNLATFICAMAAVAAVSRILFGMGRDGVLPKAFFGKLSKRFHTPVYNILLTSVIALGAIFFSDNLVGAASFISFGAITGFLMVNYSVFNLYFIRRKMRNGVNIIKYAIMPWIGVAVCVWLWIMIDKNAKIAGFIWLAVGFIYLAISTKGFKIKPKAFDIEEE
jgi:amino acid transporter